MGSRLLPRPKTKQPGKAKQIDDAKQPTKTLKLTKSSRTLKLRRPASEASEVLPRLQAKPGTAAVKAQQVLEEAQQGSAAAKTKIAEPKQLITETAEPQSGTEVEKKATKPTKRTVKFKELAKSKTTTARRLVRQPAQKNLVVKESPNRSGSSKAKNVTSSRNKVVKEPPPQFKGKPKSLSGKYDLPKMRSTPETTKFKPGLGTKVAGAAGAVVVAGIAVKAANDLKNADQQLKSGKITTAQYNQMQATNAVDIAGEALKLKKLNVTSLLLDDAIGTDPISLGIDGIGDLINGTHNAKDSVKNMEASWNKSLIKQSFTDPKAAAQRVGKDVENTGRDIGNFANKAGHEVDKAGKAVGKELNKAGQSIDKAAKDTGKAIDKAAKDTGKAIGNAAKDAGKTIDKAAKGAGKFFKGIFGGK